MSLSQPADRSQASWSTPTSSTEPKHPRLSQFLERTGWFEMAFAVVALGIYDFAAFFLGGVGINEARCPGECGTPGAKTIPLPIQLQILHDSYWVIPVLLALPLLLGLFLRRWLLLIAIMQVLVCAFLMVHIVNRANLVDDRMHGRVPCWDAKYTPANCPWDGH